MSKNRRKPPIAQDNSAEIPPVRRRKRPKGEPESYPILTSVRYGAVEITREMYYREKQPKRGTRNPHELTCPFWEYMVKSSESAWAARMHYGDTPEYRDMVAAGPVWTFDRFGMTRTKLPDGRVICVGGEHEDFYDPDFYIYNDVIVLAPDGAVEIYGYPPTGFPPTDFHSATLVGNGIYLIGSLGYGGERDPQTTPVYRLDCTSYQIDRIATRGANPGWIWEHEALYLPHKNRIRIEKGKVITGAAPQPQRENTARYGLDLSTHTWHLDRA